MIEQKQYYNVLDLVRLYCALLIVFIHMGLGDDFSIVPCLSRQGVPFFFLTSGFFLSKKLRKSKNIKQTTIQYIKPILLVYFAWILLWLPYSVIEYGRMYPGAPTKLVAILIRRIFLAGMAPYWYLLVLTESAVLLAAMIHFRETVLGILMCILGIVLGILYSYQAEYNQSGLIYRAFYTVFSWNNNVVMSGFPLLFLGFMADRYEDRISNANPVILLAFYVVSVVSAFVVFGMDKNLFFIPFGIVQAILLFCLCLIPVPSMQKISERTCRESRNLSSVVFLTHTVFLTHIGNVFHIWDSTLRYLVTILCASILYWLAKRISWDPLNRLLMVKTDY